MWIVITGNPVDGLSFVGPFDEADHADGYVTELGGEEWWLYKLVPPTEVETVKTWVLTVASDFIPPITHKTVEIEAVDAEEAKGLYQGGGIVVRVIPKNLVAQLRSS